MSEPAPFDPYALLEALERNRVSYVIVGGFARVVHGTAEITRDLDIVPSLREENLRRLDRAIGELGPKREHPDPIAAPALAAGEPLALATDAGTLNVVPAPWGTRGYDDLRIRASRENLGRGVRPAVASIVDCVRMLDASERELDAERLLRMRRMMELERRRVPRRGLHIER